jgi:2,4-dienoyl-CoA reductase-like NADH-dependent reductase (Old Yellow Enzyme family)
MPAAEFLGGPTPKELEEHEIEEILRSYESAAARAVAAGAEFHLAHGSSALRQTSKERSTSTT